MNPTENTIAAAIDEHLKTIRGLRPLAENIGAISQVLIAAAKTGKHLFICGNGGSAADSQHMAAEYRGRLEKGKELKLPATALTVDTSTLTALANDYGFDEIFSIQLEALAKAGDMLIAISTSGNSKNVLRAVETAKKIGLTTIALAGRDGGELAKMADHALVIPSDATSRIQEGHELVIHILCELVQMHTQ